MNLFRQFWSFLTRPRPWPWTKYKRAYTVLDQLFKETVAHAAELDDEVQRLRKLSNHLIAERADLEAKLNLARRELQRQKNVELRLSKAQERILALEAQLAGSIAQVKSLLQKKPPAHDGD